MKYRVAYVCTFLICAEAFGSSFRAVTFREMLEWTDTLVRAEVIEKKAVWVHVEFTDDTGAHHDYKWIYTRYRLEVSDVLYGRNPGESVDLYLPGGEKGNVSHTDSAAYNLEEGWEIVVALEWDPNRDIFVSAVSAHGVFLAREIGGETLWVNLSDYRDYAGIDPETQLTPREELTLDDWVRPRNGPPVTTWKAVEALFRAPESVDERQSPTPD